MQSVRKLQKYQNRNASFFVAIDSDETVVFRTEVQRSVIQNLQSLGLAKLILRNGM